MLLLGFSLWVVLAAIWCVRLTGEPTAHATLTAAKASPLLPCVSYAPFRRAGHTPFDPHLRLTAEALRDDLSRLARLTGCVRLYGVSHGLDQVPAIAGELGLKVAVGAWISRDAAANETELERALELARRHPDVVRAVIVGNEVLLRRELTAQQLASLLQRARAASGGVPVTYADVWEFWLRDARVLKSHVDFISIHVLPYWEDTPTGVNAAASHLVKVIEHVRQELAPLPIWVAETGWPVRGRQRGPALPGLMEQARWLADLQALHRDRGIDFNFIEGFDQPWKRQLEGVMGGAWGLLSAEGEPRTGNRLRSSLGDPEALAGLLGLLGGASIGVILSRRKGRYTALSTALGLSLFAGLMAHHLSAWIDWPRSTAEWVMGGVTPLLMMLVATRTFSKARRNRALDAALLFALAVGALTLCFDARYRILPWSMVAAAAVLAWWPLFNEADHRSPSPLAVGWSPATRLMGLGLGVAALTLPVLEGPQNTQAWGVALGWAALAVSAVVAMIKHHHLGFDQPNAAAVR
jgi:glucan 1,3-beta-glucosidase